MPYTSLVVRDVVLLCFPHDDAVFAASARGLLVDAPIVDPAALEAGLRVRFPDAVVRPRDPLASFGSSAWYLYRDGRYSPYVDGDRWWEAATAARIVIDGSGRILEGNAAAQALLGSSLDDLRSSPPAAFVVPEIRPMVPWILQLLHDTGELHSTSVVRRGDGGADLAVEFHMTRDGAGPGRHVSVMRAVPREAAGPETSTGNA